MAQGASCQTQARKLTEEMLLKELPAPENAKGMQERGCAADPRHRSSRRQLTQTQMSGRAPDKTSWSSNESSERRVDVSHNNDSRESTLLTRCIRKARLEARTDGRAVNDGSR